MGCLPIPFLSAPLSPRGPIYPHSQTQESHTHVMVRIVTDFQQLTFKKVLVYEGVDK